MYNKFFSDSQTFKMDCVCLAYCYGIDELGKNGFRDDEKLNELVSGLALRLYKSEVIQLSDDDYRDHMIADRICVDLLSSLDRECDLDRIYRKNDVDKYKANRLFKNRYGMPPYAFHKYHRLLKAGGLLLTGETNMETVAYKVGYVSESKFAESFKRQFKIRPKHFRECLIEECLKTVE
ncbi:MAG: AraC family transcriptional regulator [Candidatus Methanomethylophilaceae archaeon]|nr:AraC family transcriptional regulator [Candidatus Methanomethylophilaceae archaeon]